MAGVYSCFLYQCTSSGLLQAQVLATKFSLPPVHICNSSAAHISRLYNVERQIHLSLLRPYDDAEIILWMCLWHFSAD